MKGLTLILPLVVLLFLFTVAFSLQGYDALILGIVWGCVIMIVSVLLIKYFDHGTCEKCGTAFLWSDPLVEKGKGNKAEVVDETYIPVNEQKTKMQEQVKYLLFYKHTCLKCHHISEYPAWLEQTEWENRGDPFIIKPCPFCGGKGFNNTYNQYDTLKGKSDCGFCNHHGWVKTSKLKDLIAE